MLRSTILVAGLIGALALWFFGDPVRDWLNVEAVIANDSPSSGIVADAIRNSEDPAATALAFWKSGGIVHREVAARQMAGLVLEGGNREIAAVLRAAALDPDMNVRESAFSGLHAVGDPALVGLAAEQFDDPDPESAMLALRYLKHSPREIGVPLIAAHLNEGDPLFQAMCLKLLERWTDMDYDVLLRDTVPLENESTGLKEFRPGSEEKVLAAVERANRWWAEHSSEFASVDTGLARESLDPVATVPAPDFALKTLDGREVRLSDFRGKVVLINFWTTWCTACVGEMPELIALQDRHSDDLVILGVSLDYVPDAHGHIGGHAAVEEQGESDGHHDDHEPTAAALKRVRGKIQRTVKARGINYPVLLDERNDVGGPFNGGELPTTVIVDREGNVRRRFVGTRTLPVFDAMIKEAMSPASRD